MRRYVLAFVVLTAALSLTASAQALCDGYLVVPGDNLSRISARMGGTVAEWAQANGLANPNLIRVGQCLRRPGVIVRPVGTAVPMTGTLKGVAMAVYSMSDLELLKADYFYQWGWCSEPQCIPMTRDMSLPPSCPATLLVGNEPNAIEPYGAPRSPSDAARMTLAIESMCPQTKLVVGNVSADDWSAAGGSSGYRWIRLFLSEYTKLKGNAYRGAIGIHCYSTQWAGYCTGQLAGMRILYSGEMWVTEFGLLSGDAAQFKIIMDYVFANFAAGFVYTNKQPHTGQGWELGIGTELVNGDGTLTAAGAVFAGW